VLGLLPTAVRLAPAARVAGGFQSLDVTDNVAIHGTLAFPTGATISLGSSAAYPVSNQIVSPFAVDVRDHSEATTNVGVQAAVDNATSGGTVFITSVGGPYAFSDNVTISKPLTILSDHAVINVAAGKKGFVVASDNVTISGLTIIGAQSTPNDDEARGIDATGALATYYKNIRVINNTIKTFAGYGIYFKYIQDFDISKNKVEDIDYGAIVILASSYGTVSGNRVDNVHSSTTDGYGIEITTVGESVETDVQSTDIAVTGNSVRNNPTWKCYGSHGGNRLSFTGNTGYNCYHGVSVGPADNTSNEQEFAPKDITISGNSLDSSKTDGSAGYGINLVGALSDASASVDNATGAISGNTITGYGDATSATGCAVYLHTTNGVTVSGNTIIDPGTTAIYMSTKNYGFAITGNVIRDVWSDTHTTWAMRFVSDYQYGSISGNALVRGTKAATKVNEYGIRIDPGNVNDNISIGENYLNATTIKISDAGSFGHGYYLDNSVTYDPQELGTTVDNNYVTTDVSVYGAAMSGTAWCTHDNIIVGVFISGTVTTTGTVSCTFINKSGSTQNIPEGTLRAVVRNP
jgi:hypothetical protein